MKTVLEVNLLACLLCACSSIMAQSQKTYEFGLLDVNNGLSHGQVNSILRDSHGYMWFGTSAGLNMYNGYSIKTFTYDPRDSTSLSSSDILDLFEGPEGNLWVSTANGLNIYDHTKQSFERDLSPLLARYHLPNTLVQDILTDGEGIFWIVSQGTGITRYDRSRDAAIFLHPGSEKYPLSSAQIAMANLDTSGNLWVIYTNGLIEKIDGKTLKVTTSYNGLYERYGSQNFSYELTIDSENDLWVYMPNASYGVFRFTPSSGNLINYRRDQGPIRLNNSLVTGVVEASDGMIWIGTDHGGLNVIDKNTGQVSYYTSQPEIENSLVHNSVYHLYKDQEEIIWVGTYKNGVSYYHPSLKRFDHYRHVATLPNSLPFNDVNRFVEDDKGNLWIGTNGGGLLYFDRQKHTYSQYLTDPNDPHSLSSDVIVSMELDKSGDLWVGTYLGGLDRFDGTRFQHFTNDPADPGSIAGNNIWELFTDSRDHLWIGTLNSGLERWDEVNERFIHYSLNAVATDSSLTLEFINAIEQDDLGNLWIAGGGGVNQVEIESGKVNTELPQELSVLNGNTITSLHHGPGGYMWIASQEGLYAHKPGYGLKLFTISDGLPHHAILTMVEDESHNLWLGTPNGLSHLTIDQDAAGLQVKFTNYDERDGLQGKVFNENAALKTRNGELIFGGANGFNIFSPGQLKPDENIPKVVFTDFQLFNKSLAVGEKRKNRVVLPRSLNDLESISLKHNENVFSIEFAALSYLHPTKNEYRYMLEGFDPEWRVADQTRRVTYTNLDAGDYTFRVMASNNDGVWGREAVELNISIEPPFYATNWAYFAYTVLVLLALYLTRRIMLARERVKYQIEQERREARQMHELDMLKIRFLTNISHEFRTPLSLILAPIEKLLKSPGDDHQQKQLTMIQRNAKRLLNLVNQLLDFRKLEVDTVDLNKSKGNIIRFIEQSVHSFADLSEKKGVTLTFKADRDELYAGFDMDKMEKILFNLLSNAFKFTPEDGSVRVIVTCLDQEAAAKPGKIVQIKVTDTGIGIPFEKQKHIFERFFQNETPGTVVNQGSGIGLSITREFVKIHGGTIEVESQPGKGTCFTVRIPVVELQATQTDSVAFELEEKSIPTSYLQVESQREYEKGTPLVLLVEDNEDFRRYLKENLAEHYRVVDARNGREGWQKCLSLLPDMVVSDLMMPELDGIGLCKKIKEDQRTSHLPFILLTADVADESKLKGLNTGADDYVTKPFNYEILLSRINNLIHQHQSLQETYSRKISVETSEVEITSLSDKLIQDAIRIVEDNISNPNLSVEMLSNELGMSRAHLYKRMVALTGKTPLEFIRKIRLDRAAQFLKKSQLTVSEVAYKVGFNNRKYFSKYFKQEYNMLPSTFASEQGDQIKQA